MGPWSTKETENTIKVAATKPSIISRLAIIGQRRKHREAFMKSELDVQLNFLKNWNTSGKDPFRWELWMNIERQLQLNMQVGGGLSKFKRMNQEYLVLASVIVLLIYV